MAGDHVPREKDAKKGRNAAAITTVILSVMLPPTRGYFCGGVRMLPQGSTFCCLTSGILPIVAW